MGKAQHDGRAGVDRSQRSETEKENRSDAIARIIGMGCTAHISNTQRPGAGSPAETLLQKEPALPWNKTLRTQRIPASSSAGCSAAPEPQGTLPVPLGMFSSHPPLARKTSTWGSSHKVVENAPGSRTPSEKDGERYGAACVVMRRARRAELPLLGMTH